MIIKVICICVASCFAILVIKNIVPSYAPLISLSAGLVSIYLIAPELIKTVNTIEGLFLKFKDIEPYFEIMVKVTLISLISEFSSQLCSDHGQNYLASKIEVAGKISILFLVVPEIIKLINKMTEIILKL